MPRAATTLACLVKLFVVTRQLLPTANNGWATPKSLSPPCLNSKVAGAHIHLFCFVVHQYLCLQRFDHFRTSGFQWDNMFCSLVEYIQTSLPLQIYRGPAYLCTCGYIYVCIRVHLCHWCVDTCIAHCKIVYDFDADFMITQSILLYIEVQTTKEKVKQTLSLRVYCFHQCVVLRF